MSLLVDRISHGVEASSCLGGRPIVAFRGLVGVVAGSVDEWSRINSGVLAVWHAELIFIVVARWEVAVVVFEIWSMSVTDVRGNTQAVCAIQEWLG